MEKTTVYQISPEDLKAFFDEEYAKKDANASLNALLRRYRDVFIDIKMVALMHRVHPQTVRNYIRDGLIKPELRTVEDGKYKFRMDYALELDFEKLKQQLKERSYI
ncbi:MAG: hypothetical protein LBK58_08155 [Prevotellaceae bacterium]|jgi:AmiR/NasT family two-component response regulator|nr:hypothetical protein [Prevotellaceae bacterium]